jgi:hypothetical protein
MDLAREIQIEMQEVMDLFGELGIAIDANNVVLNEYTRDCFRVSWTGVPHLAYLFSETASIADYELILRRRDLNVLLADGAILQMCYDVEFDEIARHRLCYFPCPIKFDDEDLLAIGGVVDLLNVLSAEELLSRTRMLAPIRFDFDREEARTDHPHSHLTIGKVSCRVPVFGPLSVAHFIKFVMANYHSEHFNQDSEFTALVPAFWYRTLKRPHSYDLYLDTAIS